MAADGEPIVPEGVCVAAVVLDPQRPFRAEVHHMSRGSQVVPGQQRERRHGITLVVAVEDYRRGTITQAMTCTGVTADVDPRDRRVSFVRAPRS
ncbi:hypothetical protein GCM10009548_51310 [Streptomyces malaysiensis subsp. malaysiensis]